MILSLKKHEKKQGNSLIELIVVMAMLGLLGGVLVSLIATGGNIYQKVSANSDAQIEARMALSYVTVKLRQNDVKNGVSLPNTNVIRIQKATPSTGYWEIKSGTLPDGTAALIEDNYDVATNTTVTSTIAEGVTFTAKFGTGETSRQLTLTIVYSNGAKNLDEIITLRSDGL